MAASLRPLSASAPLREGERPRGEKRGWLLRKKDGFMTIVFVRMANVFGLGQARFRRSPPARPADRA